MTSRNGSRVGQGLVQGLVFQIIHGSFVDGYGTRTTVFLKGCPLHCDWCCNPESQKRRPQLKVTTSHCNGCGNCVPVCPTGAIRVDFDERQSVLQIDRALCRDCGACVDVCYTGALGMFGRTYSVDEPTSTLLLMYAAEPVAAGVGAEEDVQF